MFWGAIVRPGKAVPFVPGPETDRLHLSSATLEFTEPGQRAVLKCCGGEGQPAIILASLSDAAENVPIDLMFNAYVEFSCEGAAAIHLAGYFMPDYEEGPEEEEEDDDDEDDALAGFPYGHHAMFGDGDDDDDDEDDEGDDDEDEIGGGARRRSGVRIKEIEEDGDDAPAAPPPKSTPQGGKRAAEGAQQPAAKRPKTGAEASPASAAKPLSKKEKKAAAAAAAGDKRAGDDGAAREVKGGASGVRQFENGFEITDLVTGPPAGKVAKPGLRVGIRYTGTLQATGKVFDTTQGKKVFWFRLGVGEVVKGFDAGVVGMRVGDKRRLVIPAVMGYGREGVREGGRHVIPPNATLLFDVELVDVK